MDGPAPPVNEQLLAEKRAALAALPGVPGGLVDAFDHFVRTADDDALVRHEAAFSLGQLGFTSGLKALSDATLKDPSFFVRHEAAVALGVIGSEKARRTLKDALKDKNKAVRDSAVVALANLDYIKATSSNSKFTKMTGG